MVSAPALPGIIQARPLVAANAALTLFAATVATPHAELLKQGPLALILLIGMVVTFALVFAVHYKVSGGNMSRQLGIGDVQADVLPEGKNGIVRALRAKEKIVTMAGDGVNDAPALAEADVGIVMGTDTEVAIQSAAVTLVKGDLAGIARTRALSRMAMCNIRQNLVFAFAYNCVGIPVAAGVLFPAFAILLSPVVAALAMSLSSVSVIANALRLRAAQP